MITYLVVFYIRDKIFLLASSITLVHHLLTGSCFLRQQRSNGKVQSQPALLNRSTNESPLIILRKSLSKLWRINDCSTRKYGNTVVMSLKSFCLFFSLLVSAVFIRFDLRSVDVQCFIQLIPTILFFLLMDHLVKCD